MVRAVMRKPLAGQLVGILDALDGIDQVVDVDLIAVERDDHPAGDGVDLRPVDAVEPAKLRLDQARDRMAIRPAQALDLDVRATVPDPPASLAPAGRDRDPAGDR